MLGAAGDDIAKELLPEAVKRGAVVVDNSHAFRMDPEVPLVVPEINADDIKWHHGLIANPQLRDHHRLVPTWPLHQLAGVKRMIVSTYQAASVPVLPVWPSSKRSLPPRAVARRFPSRARLPPSWRAT